jgi:hypothetical protein
MSMSMSKKQKEQTEKKANSVYELITRQTKIPYDLRDILMGKIKLTEDNPYLRLSIEDYKLMCKNEILRKIMAKVLYTDIESLTAYCKDVEILDNRVNLSESTIRKKKIPTLLTHLPEDSIKLITNHYQSSLKYELIDWFPLNKLKKDYVSENLNAINFLSSQDNRIFIRWNVLSQNPNAVDFLSLPENKGYIFYHYLSCNKSSNPKLIELLKEYIEENPRSMIINWRELSKNPDAIEILISSINYDNVDWESLIEWKSLSSNPSPKAIEFLLKNINKIKWFEFSRNPCNDAITFLKENPNRIDWDGLSGNTNPAAIPLIEKRIEEENQIKKKIEEEKKLYNLSHTKKDKVSWIALTANPNAQNKVGWRALSANPNAIDLIIKKIKEGIRLNEIDWLKEIDWDALSKNPSIFISKNNIGAKSRSRTSKKELREGIPVDKLNWNILCENLNAIDLLREQMNLEENLSKEEYDRLPYKINWNQLCRNPNAIELLSLPKNYNKIDWQQLSKNPNAINLLEERVIYELSLNRYELSKLDLHQRISWNDISKNPSIFVPM